MNGYLNGTFDIEITDQFEKDEPAPRPVFIINATSMQTGERWHFHAKVMGGLQSHWTDRGETLLSEAVAASSGFPPILSTAKIELKVTGYSAP